MDHYTRFCDNIKIRDFNSEMAEEDMIEFSEFYNLKDLVKAHTCFKNPDKPTTIDLMLTNYFRHRNWPISTKRLCHINFNKGPPKVIAYRDLKRFSKDKF